MITFANNHLELLLRAAGLMQIALAVLSFFLPTIMKWQADIARMPLLLRDVFVIHSWFITLTLVIWGVLTWRFAPVMVREPSDLSRWVCGAIAVFWGIRCVLQWLHYSPKHWRGIPSRTVIHWTLFVGYAVWTGIYILGAMR